MRVAVALAFLVVPIAEIAVLIRVGQAIGPWWTILLLIAMSVLGTYLVRREWRDTWRALNTALGSGRLPSRELMDAALVVIGGTLLLTPGFVTDVLGFLLLLPLTRPLARRLVVALLAKRIQSRVVGWSSGGPYGFGSRPSGPTGPVIRGHVLEPESTPGTDSRPPA